jgi:hypothetical protein
MLLRDAKEKGAIGQKNIQIWVWMH